MSEELIFVAKRSDGLGERLRALLNAIALSQVYNARFEFYWDDEVFNVKGHAIDNADKIFDPDFIHHHQIELNKASKCLPVSEFFRTRKSGHYYCDQVVEESFFKGNKADFSCFENERASAFEKIKFSDSVMYAINVAKGIPLHENSVALHLRAGDLVYGKYSQSTSYTQKAISYPLAIDIIEDCQQQSCDVLVFGQDEKLIDSLCDNFHVSSAMNFMPLQFNKYQSAIFDIVLMSRCGSIYAGSSGFAILASWINQSVYINPMYSLGREKVVNIIFEKIINNNYDYMSSTQQEVFACKTALVHGKNLLNEKYFLELINYGKKLDENNLVFIFFEVFYFYEKNDIESAEVLLSYILKKKAEIFKMFLLNNLRTPSQKKNFFKLFKIKFVERYKEEEFTSVLYDSLKIYKDEV